LGFLLWTCMTAHRDLTFLCISIPESGLIILFLDCPWSDHWFHLWFSLEEISWPQYEHCTPLTPSHYNTH
jgi:hypothetical protein